MQTFCIPTEGDNDADATTHEVAPNDGEAQRMLATLREAAANGGEALQAAFRALPAGDAKRAVWQQHAASLKAAATDADKVLA